MLAKTIDIYIELWVNNTPAGYWAPSDRVVISQLALLEKVLHDAGEVGAARIEGIREQARMACRNTNKTQFRRAQCKAGFFMPIVPNFCPKIGKSG